MESNSFVKLLNRIDRKVNPEDKDKFEVLIDDYLKMYSEVREKGVKEYDETLKTLRKQMQQHAKEKTLMGKNLVKIINALITYIKERYIEEIQRGYEKGEHKRMDDKISDVSDSSLESKGGRKSRKTNRKPLRKRKNTLTKRRYRK